MTEPTNTTEIAPATDTDVSSEETTTEVSPEAPTATEVSDQKTYTSGLFANRDMNSAPDIEQLKRQQARQEHDFVMGKTDARPAFTKETFNLSDEIKLPDSNRSLEKAKAEDNISRSLLPD